MCGRPFIRFVTFSGYLNKIFKMHEVDAFNTIEPRRLSI